MKEMVFDHNFVIINVDKNYLNYLHKYDFRVSIEHSEPGSKKRPYIGVAMNINNLLYTKALFINIF